jgi:L-ascorbate 6-phosphate lactonase
MSSWGNVLLSEIEEFEVEQGKVVVWSLGGCGFVLRTPKQTLYIDPFFGGSYPEEGIMRMISLPLEPALIKKADIVLSTHEHEDHCHKGSLTPIYSNTGATFVGPKTSVKKFLEWGFKKSKIREVNSGDEILFEDIHIYVADSYDPLSKGAVTYIIQSGEVTLFHSGDSWYFDGFEKIGKKWSIDIAFINFGKNPPGKQLYMTPCDFLRAARDLRTRKAVPMHWDIWRYTYLDPVILYDFLKYWTPKLEVLIMRLGDKLICDNIYGQ